MNLIFDTSAVIYLMEKWNLTKELLDLAGSHRLLIPQRVKQEFMNGDVREADIVALGKIFAQVPVDLEERLLPFFNFDSSDGAIWVISHAMHIKEGCCVIDEEFGRNICRFLGVTLVGSIGIIRMMFDAGILSRAKTRGLKREITRSSFYHNKELLDELDG